MADEDKKQTQIGMDAAGQPDVDIDEQAQQESDRTILKRLAERDAEIARLKKNTVSKEKYDQLLEDFADGKFAPEQLEKEPEPEVPMAEAVAHLFAIGDKSIRKRVGNREAIKRQVDLARRIKRETGENPLVATGTPIDTESKAERWLNIMEDALAKSTDNATFEAYFKRLRSR